MARAVPLLFLAGCADFHGTVTHRDNERLVVFDVQDAAFEFVPGSDTTPDRLDVWLTSYKDACVVRNPVGVYQEAHRALVTWVGVPVTGTMTDTQVAYASTGADCAPVVDNGEDLVEWLDPEPGLGFVHAFELEDGVVEGWFRDVDGHFQGTFSAHACEAPAAPPATCTEAP